MKNKIEIKTNKTKVFFVAQAVFVLAIFVYLYFSLVPKAVFISGNSIVEPDISFEVGPGEQIIVSRDPEFENAIILEEGADISLPPGIYYWKSKNFLRESEVKTFEIESTVGLNLRVGDEKSILENSGNVDLEVKKTTGGITTSASLDVGESTEAQKEADYSGEQE